MLILPLAQVIATASPNRNCACSKRPITSLSLLGVVISATHAAAKFGRRQKTRICQQPSQRLPLPVRPLQCARFGSSWKIRGSLGLGNCREYRSELGEKVMSRDQPVANSRPASVPIMIGLERPLRRHADIGRLLLGELAEVGADLGEMEPRHLLVELLGQRVDLLLVLAGIG